MRYWWAYLVGYAWVAAQGAGLERLLNLALQRGLVVWEVRWEGRERMLFMARAADVFVLRHLARMARCRLRILSKHGLPFWWFRIRRRPAFLAGMVFFLVSLYLLGSFVWFVEVRFPQGAIRLNEQTVRAEAQKLGLAPGAWRPGLDPNFLARELLSRLPGTSWVGVRLDGTTATLEVVERVLPEAGVHAAHLVAAKDGVVVEVLVINGEARVKPGDTVHRGQILISGLVAPGPGRPPVPVKAEGRVRARVWYEARARLPLVEVVEVLTGRESSSFLLGLGSVGIWLWGPQESPYPSGRQDVYVAGPLRLGKYELPLQLVRVSYREVERRTVRRTPSQAEEIGRAKVREILAAQIPPTAQVLRYSVERFYASAAGEVLVRAVAETEEDIGTVYPLL